MGKKKNAKKKAETKTKITESFDGIPNHTEGLEKTNGKYDINQCCKKWNEYVKLKKIKNRNKRVSKKNKNSLRIMSFNVYSYTKRCKSENEYTKQFKLLISELDPDILCLQESIENHKLINGLKEKYELYRCEADHNLYNDTYYKKTISKNITTPTIEEGIYTNKDNDNRCISTIKYKNINICNLHLSISPQSRIKNSINFHNFINKIYENNNNIIVVGDFNDNKDSKNLKNIKGNILEDSTEIKNATSLFGDVVDHILVTEPIKKNIVKSDVYYTNISDHFPLILDIIEINEMKNEEAKKKREEEAERLKKEEEKKEEEKKEKERLEKERLEEERLKKEEAEKKREGTTTGTRTGTRTGTSKTTSKTTLSSPLSSSSPPASPSATSATSKTSAPLSSPLSGTSATSGTATAKPISSSTSGTAGTESSQGTSTSGTATAKPISSSTKKSPETIEKQKKNIQTLQNFINDNNNDNYKLEKIPGILTILLAFVVNIRQENNQKGGSGSSILMKKSPIFDPNLVEQIISYEIMIQNVLHLVIGNSKEISKLDKDAIIPTEIKLVEKDILVTSKYIARLVLNLFYSRFNSTSSYSTFKEPIVKKPVISYENKIKTNLKALEDIVNDENKTKIQQILQELQEIINNENSDENSKKQNIKEKVTDIVTNLKYHEKIESINTDDLNKEELTYLKKKLEDILKYISSSNSS